MRDFELLSLFTFSPLAKPRLLGTYDASQDTMNFEPLYNVNPE